MRWGRLCLGFILGVGAGVTLGHAWSGAGSTMWIIGILALLLGVVSTVLAIPRSPRVEGELEEGAAWNQAAAPPLGQMLINYGLISESDLARALKRQTKSKKRLGQLLVEMDLVSHAQVAEVLEEQLSRREGRLLWGGGRRLVT